VATSAVAVALALMLAVVVYLIMADRARVKDTRVAVARLDTEVRKISSEQAKLEGRCVSRPMPRYCSGVIC
jgi:hypothetical protein